MSSIQRKSNGFYEWDANPQLKQPHAIGVQSLKLTACLAHYNQVKAGGLFGHPEFGFKEDNLNFLKLAKVKPTWLWFWDIKLKNVDALYLLEQIDYFGIHPERPGIDFSRFRRLGTVINHWNKDDVGIAQAKIGEYHLWHYKPRHKSFEGVEFPSAVRRLELYWANPASLDGMPVLKRLKHLEIHCSRNLSDLSALPRIAPNLKNLLTTSCSRLQPKDGVLNHPTLRSAYISGKELLSGQP